MEKIKELANHIGIDADTLGKIESGEVNPADYAKTFLSDFETNLKTRIGSELEKNIRAEETAKAYGSVETYFGKEFGIDLKELEGVEGAKRRETIAKKIKALQQQQLEAIQNGEGKAVAQLTKQLEEANAQLDQTKNTYEAKIQEIQNSYQQKETQRVFEQNLRALVSGFENPRLESDIMQDAFESEMRREGYSFKLDAENNKIWIFKDGAPVANPKKPTTNLDLNSYFEIVAEKRKFKKESNGGTPAKTIELVGADGKPKAHPNFVKRNK